MAYVIKRTNQGGGYLANPSHNSGAVWTRNLQRARRFIDYESAKEECCPGNEIPVSIDGLLQPYEP